MIFQIETLNTVPPGRGSFRLAENNITVKLRKKGTTTFHTVTMPIANSDAGGTRADVDGVLSRGNFGTQYDGFWFNKGDLYRTQFQLPAAFLDVDSVQVTLNITKNVLTGPETLAVSMNGIKLGEVVVQPGNSTKSATFATVFVNPAANTRDVGANLYGKTLH